MLFSKRYGVTIIDKNWNVIHPNMKLKYVPRTGEQLFLFDKDYYKVISLVHNINEKHGIFVCVELITKDEYV